MKEKKKMEKENWNNIHISKEITKCKCERHRNPSMKNVDLGFAIILKLSWRTYTAKDYNGFNPLYLFKRYNYSIWISQTDIWESKFVTTEGHPLTNSGHALHNMIHIRKINKMWSTRKTGLKPLLHIPDGDIYSKLERSFCTWPCSQQNPCLILLWFIFISPAFDFETDDSYSKPVNFWKNTLWIYFKFSKRVIPM